MGLRPVFGTEEAAHFKFGKQIEPAKCQSKHNKLPPKEAWSWSRDPF